LPALAPAGRGPGGTRPSMAGVRGRRYPDHPTGGRGSAYTPAGGDEVSGSPPQAPYDGAVDKAGGERSRAKAFVNRHTKPGRPRVLPSLWLGGGRLPNWVEASPTWIIGVISFRGHQLGADQRARQRPRPPIFDPECWFLIAVSSPASRSRCAPAVARSAAWRFPAGGPSFWTGRTTPPRLRSHRARPVPVAGVLRRRPVPVRGE